MSSSSINWCDDVLRPRWLLVVDVEDSCHSFVSNAINFCRDIVVVLVVPKSWTQDSPELQKILPRQLKDIKKEELPIVDSRYNNTSEHLCPLSKWCFLLRANSSLPQAVDIRIQTFLTTLSLLRSSKISRSGQFLGLDKSTLKSECNLELENVLDSQCNRYRYGFDRDFLFYLNDIVLLTVVAASDDKYKALVEEFNSPAGNAVLRVNIWSVPKDSKTVLKLCSFTESELTTVGGENTPSICLKLTRWYQSSSLFICPWCSYIFDRNHPSSITKHFDTKHHYCRSCGTLQGSPSKHELNQICKYCPSAVSPFHRHCERGLKLHIALNHAAQLSKEVNEANKRLVLKQLEQSMKSLFCPVSSCKRSKKRFEAKYSKDQHVEAKHPELQLGQARDQREQLGQTLVCSDPLCKRSHKPFASQTDRDQHNATKHQQLQW